MRFRSALALAAVSLLAQANVRAESEPAVTVFEAPAPRPTATPSSAPAVVGSGLTVDDRDNRADHFIVRLSLMSGAAQNRQFEVEGGGKTVRGAVAVDGYGGAQTLPYGQIDAGTSDRFATVGEQRDPLGGLIFYPARTTGAAYTDERRGLGMFDVQRSYRAHYVGASLAARHRTYTFAATPARPISSAMFGVRDVAPQAGGTLTRELWLGTHGVAAGMLYQSSGRLFVEWANGFATSGMPIEAGDLPRRANAGYRVSPALTMRAGRASAYGSGSSAYLSASLATRNESAIFTKASNTASTAMTFHDENGYAEFSYAVAADQHDWRFDGARVAGAGQIDMLASFMQGYSDARVEYRSSRSASSLFFGLEVERERGVQRFAGPLAGLSLPVDRDLSVQFEMRPSFGRQAVRVSFAQRIDVPARRTSRRTRVIVQGAGGANVQYFIDDAACQPNGDSVQIPDGEHTLIVATSDNSAATLPIDVNGGTAQVQAVLFPIRSLRGRVVVSDPQDFVGAPQLDGIEVRLIPGTASAVTAADGSFALPPAPIAPDARLAIVSDSLPEGLQAGDPLALPAGAPPAVPVRASRRIETTRLTPSRT
ncbi:MAG TPA: hypothetical protein VJP85_10120 [Candidatus Baltobacteraceae bacterium]|nr:hypothetical protein [Candidatus Baltobacteraceae bacterium]